MDTSTWNSKTIRQYDPLPRPDQPRGNCVGCQKCMALNAAGNRKAGRILNMDDADRIYALATTLDPWEGAWPPEDTGSSGLAGCQAAQQLGLGGAYEWILNGADGVVQAIMDGHTVGVGTWWYEGGFEPALIKGKFVAEMTGKKKGGHQWHVHAYDEPRDLVGGRCWWDGWAKNGDFWIKREHLAELLADDGDAHTQAAA